MGQRVRWVLLVSGLIGFWVGAAVFPDWQVAVETSQVMAGVVKYPALSPFFIYHVKLWTILHQICALLLLSHVSEIRLSLLLSGVLGMVTFQAISTVVLAFSQDALLAIGAAVLIFLTRSAEYGAVYGLFLLGTENTYGILGLSFCLLAVALIGAGAQKAGALLLGMAPAVHPALGVWTGAIVACALLFDLRSLRRELRPALPWFLAGCAITLISLGIQLAFMHQLLPRAPDRAFSSSQLSAFVRFWDGHRKPVDLTNNGVLLNFGALGLASIWLFAFKDQVPNASRFLLRFVVASALVSIALVFVSWIPPERIPPMLLVLMPGRVLNFDALIYVAMLIGLLGNYRRIWSGLVLLLLVAGLMVGDHSMLWEWLQTKASLFIVSPVRPLWIVTAASILLVVGALVDRWRARLEVAPTAVLLRRTCVAVLLLGVIPLFGLSRPRAAIFHDRTNDVFFSQVAAGTGMLLTAGDLHLIQLKTRRPVLLDGGGLDGVMYSLDAGPEMERILRGVYGVDLLNPPDEARGAGRIPPLANQKVWEGYSTDRWREIGRTFRVAQVLTYPDWTLNLPLAAQSRRLLLYQIPQ